MILRNEKRRGISLIVLVITIVVIIILSVAIILSISNNNPIDNANNAVNANDISQEKELINLALTDSVLNTEDNSITRRSLADSLEKSLGQKVDVVSKGNGIFAVTMPSGREYTVDLNGTITKSGIDRAEAEKSGDIFYSELKGNKIVLKSIYYGELYSREEYVLNKIYLPYIKEVQEGVMTSLGLMDVENIEEYFIGALNALYGANVSTKEEALEFYSQAIGQTYESWDDYLLKGVMGGYTVEKFLSLLGFAQSSIDEVDLAFEKYTQEINSIVVPDEYSNITYEITYPNGSIENVQGSQLKDFKSSYNITEVSSNLIITIKGKVIQNIKIDVSGVFEPLLSSDMLGAIFSKIEFKTTLPDNIDTSNAITLNEWYEKFSPDSVIDLSIYKNKSVIGYVEFLDNNDFKLYICNNQNVTGKESKIKATTGYYLFSTHDTKSSIKEIINLNNLDVSNVSNFAYTFSGIDMSNIDVSNFDVSRGTLFQGMFYNCTNLKKLDVSKWDVSNGTDFMGVFGNCENLEEIDVSNWDMVNATNIQQMFQRCKKLKTIDVSKWDVSNISNFNLAFAYCTSLENLDVSNWNTSSANQLIGTFGYCSTLSNLDVSNFDVSNVTTLFQIFRGCTNLSELNVGNWNVSNVTKFSEVFRECSNLQSLDLSKWNTIKCTDSGDYMFSECTNLTSIKVGNNWSETMTKKSTYAPVDFTKI